ncbi:hypothetical protein EJ08DRAFT_496696 [Tothia fuscella]|uniref:Uncharacterized protein n=1 Tax=Tothia fuscella TaxID=1048955 RepID=A0A9P4NZ06_9PEZI|nr:hypothetical protein EJ08DRAFT_496696 [Tothia fuscella]
MGCFGRRDGERAEITAQQRWDYITLSDFKSKSCGTILSYCWLWILCIVSVAVYAADTFTAYKLIKLKGWTSEYKPPVSLEVARWIFVGCIIASWALAIHSFFRAFLVIRRGCVTEDYLDPMAVTLQSIRFGSGWKRFLVFAALTKSKKKVSWIALFVYFQRKDAIRLLAAEGPRSVINALTLWGVLQSNLISGPNKDHTKTGIDKFFNNVKILGEKDRTQTIILSTMLFSLVIWVLFMIFLILAFFLYLFFLWHHIQDNTLTGFCRKKVETRLARIVKAKTDKIWAKQAAQYEKEANKAAASSLSLDSTLTHKPQYKRQPTLPTIGGSPPSKSLASTFTRSDSIATLPAYTSQPTTPYDGAPPVFGRQATLPNMGNGLPPPLSRQGTGYSTASYDSDAPLLSQAGSMGYSDPSRPGPSRSVTGGSARSMGPVFGGPQGTATRPPLPALATNGYQNQGGPRYPPPTRTGTGFSQQSRESPMSARTQNYTPSSAGGHQGRRISPISPYDQPQGPSFEMTPVEQRGYNNGMPDYFPQQHQGRGQHAAGSLGLPASLQMPRRDMSAPLPGRGPAPQGGLPWPPNRSATAPVPDYARGPTERSYTAGPRGY